MRQCFSKAGLIERTSPGTRMSTTPLATRRRTWAWTRPSCSKRGRRSGAASACSRWSWSDVGDAQDAVLHLGGQGKQHVKKGIRKGKYLGNSKGNTPYPNLFVIVHRTTRHLGLLNEQMKAHDF